MDRTEALKQLDGCIEDDGGLHNLGHYMAWDPKYPDRITLDSEFDADQLEAIVWWMRNTKEFNAPSS